jgi:hypothetical protein
MDWLIWSGAAVTQAGLAGLVAAILRALAVRRAAMSDEATRAALQRIVPLNLGSLFLSTLGLMLVVVGILLG